jgi:phosphatidylglycerol---prolipoprotein diacylglyceryl transferase
LSQLLFIPWFKAEAIEVGPIPVQPFGILVAMGVLLAVRLAESFGKRQGISPRVITDLSMHVLVGGFAGAYFGNRITYEPEKYADYFPYLAVLAPVVGAWSIAWLVRRMGGGRFAALPERGVASRMTVSWLVGVVLMAYPAYLAYQFVADHGIEYLGLSSYTGFAGSVVGLLVWKSRRGLSMIAVGDVALWAFPVGWLFGRAGCFITHDHPGAVTDFFLGVADWDARPSAHIPFFGYGVVPGTGGPTRHDLGLYEVLWSAACLVLFLVLGRRRRRRGFYMGLICVLYAPVRFGLDFLRAEPSEQGDIRYLGLTPGQYGSILLLLVGLFVWRWIYTHPEASIPKQAAWPVEAPQGPTKSARTKRPRDRTVSPASRPMARAKRATRDR